MHLLPNPIRTIELAAWDFDNYESRPRTLDREKFLRAHELVVRRQRDHFASALCHEETQMLREVLDSLHSRSDLHAEMLGLEWTLGVVDLCRLLAFQRRLSFHAAMPPMVIPQQGDWRSLIAVAFPAPAPILCDLIHDVQHDAQRETVTVRSSNPNLQFRVTQDPAAPVVLHAGSPFFEVAQYADRWFLRDGYHRAYRLLQAGIFQLPAVIVRARTLAELGAVNARFFSERILLSEHPPLLSDFLDDTLTIQYDRPQTITTLRITMQQSIANQMSASLSGEQP